MAELSKGEFGKSDGIALAELKLRDLRVAHLQKESSYGSVSVWVWVCVCVWGGCKPHCCSSTLSALIHLMRCVAEAKMAAQRKLGFGKEEIIITGKRHKASRSGLASE